MKFTNFDQFITESIQVNEDDAISYIMNDIEEFFWEEGYRTEDEMEEDDDRSDHYREGDYATDNLNSTVWVENPAAEKVFIKWLQKQRFGWMKVGHAEYKVAEEEVNQYIKTFVTLEKAISRANPTQWVFGDVKTMLEQKKVRKAIKKLLKKDHNQSEIDEVLPVAMASAAEAANYHDYAGVSTSKRGQTHWTDALTQLEGKRSYREIERQVDSMRKHSSNMKFKSLSKYISESMGDPEYFTNMNLDSSLFTDMGIDTTTLGDLGTKKDMIRAESYIGSSEQWYHVIDDEGSELVVTLYLALGGKLIRSWKADNGVFTIYKVKKAYALKFQVGNDSYIFTSPNGARIINSELAKFQ